MATDFGKIGVTIDENHVQMLKDIFRPLPKIMIEEIK
jgi:hypothetical protein